MKKLHFVLVAATAVLGFTACKDSEKDAAKQDAENLSSYVDSVETATPVYTQANWTVIDEGYRVRAEKAEAALAQLEAADKEKTEKAKAKYAALKLTYEAKIKEAEGPKTPVAGDYRSLLRTRLFGEGKVGADMSFNFVNADNILSTYQNFVDAVDAGKDDFTREDWDEIKVLYEALDNRKNEVEKEGLKGADNLKIAGLKVKFAAIKSVNRPGAKVKENVEAKQ
jgi:hypothetical protein